MYIDLSNIIYQQDNASSHVSHKSKEWLKISAKEHGFSVVKWLLHSPDMNPIENLWAHLKLEPHRRYSDINSLQESPEGIKMISKTRLNEEWWQIEKKILRNLIDSMCVYYWIIRGVRAQVVVMGCHLNNLINSHVIIFRTLPSSRATTSTIDVNNSMNRGHYA